MKKRHRDEHEWRWMVQLEGDLFQVGGWKKETRKFYPICSCRDYQRAQQICEALQGFIPAYDFVVKGVE
jgi:hypothetical protein